MPHAAGGQECYRTRQGCTLCLPHKVPSPGSPARASVREKMTLAHEATLDSTVVQTIWCVRGQWPQRFSLMDTFLHPFSRRWWSPQTLHQRMIHLHGIFRIFLPTVAPSAYILICLIVYTVSCARRNCWIGCTWSLQQRLLRPRKTALSTIGFARRQSALRLVLMERTPRCSTTCSCTSWGTQHCIYV